MILPIKLDGKEVVEALARVAIEKAKQLVSAKKLLHSDGNYKFAEMVVEARGCTVQIELPSN